jgi:hypothetical protein
MANHRIPYHEAIHNNEKLRLGSDVFPSLGRWRVQGAVNRHLPTRMCHTFERKVRRDRNAVHDLVKRAERTRQGAEQKSPKRRSKLAGRPRVDTTKKDLKEYLLRCLNDVDRVRHQLPLCQHQDRRTDFLCKCNTFSRGLDKVQGNALRAIDARIANGTKIGGCKRHVLEVRVDYAKV